MPGDQPQEREALDEIERRLTLQGYALLRDPPRDALPSFLQAFTPDAIAIGKTPQLLIEVISRRASSSSEAMKVRQLQGLLKDHPEWRLEVVYAGSSAPIMVPETPDAIRARLAEVRTLARVDRRAGLIMAWSVLEAVARVVEPERTSKALTPATVVELMASLGYVVESEAETLRTAGRARNQIVHGDLGLEVSEAEVDGVLEILDELIGHVDRKSLRAREH